ncbi:MAG: peptidase T [candidate division KSB1 bacterium]|nr:peptidase T [candidate division KSB1 bacterium]
MAQTVVERFLRYVAIDTQSAEDAATFPSTEKQKVLGKMLVEEFQAMGLKARMDEHGYVYAELPANGPDTIPTIGFIAHLDTSPDVSGEGVRPIIHRNYQGGDIVLPGDPGVVIRAAENPALANQIGNDIITADGTTLLGADDKAGIAEILTAVEHLLAHPEIPRGPIKIAITPDEEVGQGTKFFDVEAFGADYAYTVDGETVGEIENETFCADTVVLTVHGVNVHPGYAKGKMVNAIKIAAEIIDQLPKNSLSPETTEGREGYLHPNSITGGVEQTTIKFLVRDFTVEGLKRHEELLRVLADKVMARHPRARLEFEVQESYRNMKYKLDEDPKVVEYALEAVRRVGLQPKLSLIRGGTDGARLCYQGLLTPNIFTGGHNFHSRQEWISVQDMEKAVAVLVELVRVWAEKSTQGQAS